MLAPCDPPICGRLVALGRRLLAGAALSMTLAGHAPASMAGPPPWPDGEFSYYADKLTLAEVLQDFAAGFNLALDSVIPMTELVNGRFNVRNPTEFINRLGGTYGFVWFTHAGRLYISAGRDMQVRSIASPIVGTPNNTLRQVLTSLGVFETKFGWAEMPERNAVMVSGPPSYIDLIERTMKALPGGPTGLQVAVFRLKHASVQDRTVSYRDREITSPGVATILRNLISGSAFARTTERIVQQPNLRAGDSSNEGVGQRGAQSGSGTGDAAAETTARPGTGGPNIGSAPRVQPSIQSEPRTNSIIVQDTPDRIPIYERLIAQLDVPTKLVEIEAMIIDVNTSRLSELGVAWGTSFDGQRSAVGMGNLSDTADRNTLSVGRSNAPGMTPTTTVVSGASYFIARLRALEQQGDAAIQARPSILTAENLGAVIDLSETQYIQTVAERTALVTPITAGTTLRVTPRMVGEGQDQRVHLTLDIEDGQIQSAAAGTRPSIRRGVVSTEATIRADESLLIGGYNSVQTVKGEDKVPLIGDIPLFGNLFRSQTEQLQRRERLFLIRSTVATSDSAMAVRPIPELQFDAPRTGAALMGPRPPSRATVGTQSPDGLKGDAKATESTIPGTNISVARDPRIPNSQ